MIKSEIRIFRQQDILHIPALGFDGIIGYSPIAMVRNAIGLAIACEEFGAKFFENGARPGGVLEHSTTIKNFDKLREEWQKIYGGSQNTGKVAILEEGMKYQQISIPPHDAQFLDTRKFQLNEIARIFRVPPHRIADLERATFSNIEHLRLEFMKFSLNPWVIRWEQGLNKALLTEKERGKYFVKFNVDGLMRGDYQNRMQGYSIGGDDFLSWLFDEITPKDFREELNSGDGDIVVRINSDSSDVFAANEIYNMLKEYRGEQFFC